MRAFLCLVPWQALAPSEMGQIFTNGLKNKLARLRSFYARILQSTGRTQNAQIFLLGLTLGAEFLYLL